MSFHAIDFERGALQSREIHAPNDCVRVDVRRFTTSFDDAARSTQSVAGAIVVAGDVRLDDEAELASRVGSPGAHGLDLVARAYVALGDGFERSLFGDFAFVLVDRQRRVLVAVRDPSGVRPLVYRRGADCVFFARDPITMASGGSDLDEESIFEFLRGVPVSGERTMFRDVSRLPPGHVLRASADAPIRVERFWRPAEIDLELSAAGSHDRFRAFFLSAVDTRVKSDGAAIVTVSGGLDSSAIAVAAARTRPRAELGLAHAHFREADELEWVRAVSGRLDRPIAILDAAPSPAIDDECDPSHPFRDPLAAGARKIAALGEELGARVVLSGIGGDELLFERGVYRDLATQGQWSTLFRETILSTPYSTRSGRFFLRDALVSRIPEPIRALRRRLRRAPGDKPWIRCSEHGAGRADPEPAAFRSHTRELTWTWITGAALAATIESEERAWRRAGLELRVPFLDRKLAELVLALPYALRLPRGRMKAILRDSLGDLLPSGVRERQVVTSYDGALRAAIRAKKSAISAIFETGPWCSEPFVDRTSARRAFASIEHETSDIDVVTALWDVASLELWLRERA